MLLEVLKSAATIIAIDEPSILTMNAQEGGKGEHI
jgi:hypothetical protein